MSMSKNERLQKVMDARQVISQGIETMQGLNDEDDKLTALKTSYQIAIEYMPDNIERQRKLYLIDVDKYIDLLNEQRSLNLYKMEKHKTKARIERDKILHKRQEALIAFQKYSLVHGRIYQDNIVILDDDYRVIKITASQFYNYIKPYQDFLQKEFTRLHPDIKK